MKKLVLTLIMSLVLGSGTAWAAPDDYTHKAIQAQVSAYAEALLARDRAAVESLLSKRLRDDLRTKGSAAGVEDPLGSYIESERRKLERALEGTRRVDIEVGQVQSQLRDSPSVLAALSLNGKALSKPLPMVLEDGVYKVDPGSVQQLRSQSSYNVANYSALSRDIGCANNRHYTVGSGGWVPVIYCDPYGFCFVIDYAWAASVTPVTCEDYACTWYSDGTYFQYTQPGASAPTEFHCDYNTWGDDFIIEGDGSGHCNDAC